MQAVSGFFRAFVLAGVASALCAGAVSASPARSCAQGEFARGDTCVSHQAVAETIRKLVTDTIKRDDLNAVIVSVKLGDTRVVHQAWGETMTGVPATTAMHFRNGAIAIPYLTTVLLQLHDEGRLALTDPLSKWFPDYPKADKITLEMLANSTSGYADYVLDLGIYDNVFRQWRVDELIKVALLKKMVCEPGTCFTYSHANFVILGEVMRKVTGEPVEALIAARILKPLGLTNTRSEDTAVIQEPVLHAFTGERKIYEDSTYWNPSWTLARGAVMTTDISDALTSIAAIGEGRLVSAASHRRQIAPLTAKFPPMSETLFYGLGVVVANGWIVQTPSFGGYAAAVASLPSRRIAIAVTNTMGPKSPDENISQRLTIEIGQYLAPDQKPNLRR